MLCLCQYGMIWMLVVYLIIHYAASEAVHMDNNIHKRIQRLVSINAEVLRSMETSLKEDDASDYSTNNDNGGELVQFVEHNKKSQHPRTEVLGDDQLFKKSEEPSNIVTNNKTFLDTGINITRLLSPPILNFTMLSPPVLNPPRLSPPVLDVPMLVTPVLSSFDSIIQTPVLEKQSKEKSFSDSSNDTKKPLNDVIERLNAAKRTNNRYNNDLVGERLLEEHSVKRYVHGRKNQSKVSIKPQKAGIANQTKAIKVSESGDIKRIQSQTMMHSNITEEGGVGPKSRNNPISPRAGLKRIKVRMSKILKKKGPMLMSLIKKSKSIRAFLKTVLKSDEIRLKNATFNIYSSLDGYKSPLELIRHSKSIGVNTIKRTSINNKLVYSIMLKTLPGNTSETRGNKTVYAGSSSDQPTQTDVKKRYSLAGLTNHSSRRNANKRPPVHLQKRRPRHGLIKVSKIRGNVDVLLDLIQKSKSVKNTLRNVLRSNATKPGGVVVNITSEVNGLIIPKESIVLRKIGSNGEAQHKNKNERVNTAILFNIKTKRVGKENKVDIGKQTNAANKRRTGHKHESNLNTAQIATGKESVHLSYSG